MQTSGLVFKTCEPDFTYTLIDQKHDPELNYFPWKNHSRQITGINKCHTFSAGLYFTQLKVTRKLAITNKYPILWPFSVPNSVHHKYIVFVVVFCKNFPHFYPLFNDTTILFTILIYNHKISTHFSTSIITNEFQIVL